jgi:hypothetical protein
MGTVPLPGRAIIQSGLPHHRPPIGYTLTYRLISFDQGPYVYVLVYIAIYILLRTCA